MSLLMTILVKKLKGKKNLLYKSWESANEMPNNVILCIPIKKIYTFSFLTIVSPVTICLGIINVCYNSQQLYPPRIKAVIRPSNLMIMNFFFQTLHHTYGARVFQKNFQRHVKLMRTCTWRTKQAQVHYLFMPYVFIVLVRF